MTSGQARDYAFAQNPAGDRFMRERRADVEAGFLLAFLEPGKSIVDFGCGQGTITVGLAEAVVPGEVLGFDLQEDHVVRAQELAKERGLSNITFKVGDVFDPPCAPASFDLAYANAVLSHLSDPNRCLRVMYDTLKPGGIVAIRDRGGGYVLSGRNHDLVRQAYEIVVAVLDKTSQNPYGSQNLGGVLNKMCREAGLDVEKISASWTVTTTAEQIARGRGSALPGPMAARAIEMGLTSREEVAELDERYAEWLEDPDGYLASAWFEVVARRP